MDQDRLVRESLGKLNRGLLIFRLGVYAAVGFGLLQRSTDADGWIALALVVVVAFIPAIPDLPGKIEIGVASTLVIEFGLTLMYGAFPALQVMAMFSVAVAGLFLTKRAAGLAVAGALVLQGATLVVASMGRLQAGGDIPDLVAETVLLTAAGVGFIGLGGILRDYQGRLIDRAREELRLTEMIESKDRLIDTIAHEIRTPVTAVLGLSSELSSIILVDTREAGEIADVVATESRRLAHLVDNLVLRSRDEINKLSFTSEDLVISRILDSSWLALGLDPDDLVVEGDAVVVGDPKRLQHTFVNIFDNAMRHGALPVLVSVEEDGRTARIRVSDSGPGFDKAIASRAFDRYESGRDPGRPDHVGLGLPVSRQLVERLGGELWIEPNATVVSLPAALATAHL